MGEHPNWDHGFGGRFWGLVGLVGVGIVEWGVGRGADCGKREGWVFCLVA